MPDTPGAFAVPDAGGGTRLRLRVKPKAAREGILGPYGDSLKIAVKEAPEGGRANRAVCELLARLLSVDAGSIGIVAGEGSRNKVVRVDSLSPDECRRRLRRYLG